MNNNNIKKYSAGDIILREGDVNLDIFKILSGKAELYLDYGTDNAFLLGVLGKDNCFGEFGLLLAKPAPYTVIATTDMLIYSVNEDKIDEFIKDNHTGVLQIMRGMADTILLMQHHIKQLSEELEENMETNKRLIDRNRAMLKKYINYDIR